MCTKLKWIRGYRVASSGWNSSFWVAMKYSFFHFILYMMNHINWFLLFVLGVFTAAHDLKIDCVIVKGVSHFTNDSDPPDDLWKSFACTMAASLVSNMLSDPLVFRDWPHYCGKYSSA